MIQGKDLPHVGRGTILDILANLEVFERSEEKIICRLYNLREAISFLHLFGQKYIHCTHLM